MFAMIAKEFRQMRRDRRTLAMMILMPVVLLLVFGYAASFDVATIHTAVGGSGADQAAALLPAPFAVDRIDATLTIAGAEDLLRRGDVAVVLIVESAGATALVDGSQLFVARAAKQAFSGASAPLPIDVRILFNPDLDTSAVLVPGLAGLILLFVGMLVTSLGVVRERQAGTLEQLAVMPFSPWDVFIGKIAPYFVVAALDLGLVLVVGTLVFSVPFNGSLAVLALGALLFLFVTLGLGVLISSVSNNQGEAIQLALIALMPQVLLSGIIFPLDSMGAGVRWIGYVLPLSYFNMIAKGVMLRGAPLSALVRPMVILAILGGIVFTLATVRFARDLAPSRRSAK